MLLSNNKVICLVVSADTKMYINIIAMVITTHTFMSLSHKAQNPLTVNYRHSTLAYYVCVCIFRHGEYLAKYVVQFRRDVIQIFYKRVSFFCEIIFIILGTHLPRPIRNAGSQKRDAFVKYLHYIGAHLVYNCAVCVSQNSALPRGAVLWFRYKRYVTSHGPT
jgi:hypothetical protein